MDKEELNKIAGILQELPCQLTKVVFCEKINEESQVWNLKRHDHDYMELIYFLNGNARIEGRANNWNIAVYDVIVYPEKIPHQELIDLSRHQEIICLGIELQPQSGISQIFSVRDPDSRLKWFFQEIFYWYKGRIASPNSTDMLSHLISLLFSYLADFCQVEKLVLQDPFDKVLHYLEENFASSMSVKEMASMAGVSTSYLNRLFNQRVGESPKHYMNRLRIEAAKQLLGHREYTLATVAEMVGIEDAKYFSRLFKKYTTIPPSEYMKN